MAQGVVYMFKNKENGMMYIGQTLYEKLRIKHHLYAASHFGSRNEGQPFVKALREYGIESFDYEILYKSDNIEDKAELKSILEEKERYFIEKFDSINKGYNVTKGGKGVLGYKTSIENCKRLSKLHKGKKLSEKHKRANIERFDRIRRSDKFKKMMSDRMSGSGNPMYGVRLTGELNHNYGKHMSNETKNKISESKKGKPGHKHTEETKRAISEMFKGIPKSENTKRKISESLKGKPNERKQKHVVQYSKDGIYIKEWRSIKDAEHDLGIVHISECANGKRNFAGGYVWRYKSGDKRDSINKVYTKTERPIEQIDEYGNVIKEFRSIRDASNSLNIRYSGISEVLRGTQKRTKGLMFRYSKTK